MPLEYNNEATLKVLIKIVSKHCHMSLKLHSLKDKWPLGSNLHRILASKCLFSKTETLSLSHTFLVVFISNNCSGIIKSLHNKADRLILIFFSFSSYNSLKHTYSQAWISWRCFFRPFWLRQTQSCLCTLQASFLFHFTNSSLWGSDNSPLFLNFPVTFEKMQGPYFSGS